MPTSLLPSLLLSILALGYSPGPANIYSLSCALRFGRRKALRMWFGLLTGFSIAALITATATHFIGMALGEYVSYIRYIGAAYLVYLAIKMIRSTGTSSNDSSSTSFVSGMIVQMTNAKMLLYEMTVYSTFVLPYSNKLIDLYIVAAWLLIAGPGANLVWLLAGDALKPFFDKYTKQINILMALMIIICAIAIIIL